MTDIAESQRIGGEESQTNLCEQLSRGAKTILKHGEVETVGGLDVDS